MNQDRIYVSVSKDTRTLHNEGRQLGCRHIRIPFCRVQEIVENGHGNLFEECVAAIAFLARLNCVAPNP